MAHRPLGRTNLLVSPIAFGAFKIGRNQKIKYAHAYDLPSDQEVSRLLNGILDLGINLIDTAPAYGLSEERIGQTLSHRRREFILSTKVGETFENGLSTYDFSAPAIRHSIHRSLQRLRTDVLDFVFIHSNGDDHHILHHTDTPATLLDLKAQGLIRYVGLSGKTPQGARDALAWADALMIEYHPNDLSHETLLADAAHQGLALLIKKPLASGALPPDTAIPFILRNPHVATLVIGGLNLQHIQHNLQIATHL